MDADGHGTLRMLSHMEMENVVQSIGHGIEPNLVPRRLAPAQSSSSQVLRLSCLLNGVERELYQLGLEDGVLLLGDKLSELGG